MSYSRIHYKNTSILVSLILLTIGLSTNAQENSHYAVVGAFSKESNAKRLSGAVKNRFFQSTYEYNQNRKLYYVYAIKTLDRTEVVSAVKNLRQESEFHDSWVFSPNRRNNTETNPPNSPESTINSVPQLPYIEHSHHEPSTSHSETDSVESPISPVADSISFINDAPTPEKKLKRIVSGKLFKFDIRQPDGQPFVGKVHHVDLRKELDIASYSSEDYADVPKPENPDKPMTIICGIFGYKEITRIIDYNDPTLTDGVTQDEENAWVIPFPLERLKLKDESIMYNVGFHENAVIMESNSRSDLDELVNMMKSNPRYKIRIHGHANERGIREIYLMGKNKNYFEMDGAKKKKGTGKELSRHRAEIIRTYLVDHGIAHSRMSVKAHGGTHMIVHGEHNAATRNDRIEIEITAE